MIVLQILIIRNFHYNLIQLHNTFESWSLFKGDPSKRNTLAPLHWRPNWYFSSQLKQRSFFLLPSIWVGVNPLKGSFYFCSSFTSTFESWSLSNRDPSKRNTLAPLHRWPNWYFPSRLKQRSFFLLSSIWAGVNLLKGSFYCCSSFSSTLGGSKRMEDFPKY